MKPMIVSTVTVLLLLFAMTPGTHAATYAFQNIVYPGASGTQAYGINNFGDVAGYYWDYLGNEHGFVRNAADGSFSTFDDPSGIDETQAFGINDNGEVTGTYVGTDYITHSFMRSADGLTFTNFDAPGALEGQQNTYAFSICNSDEIAGWYTGRNSCGYVRDAGGSFISVCYPSAVWGTAPVGINNNGQITGYYTDANLVSHGFWGPINGPFTSFDDPSAGTDIYSGTLPYGINDGGEISGYYSIEEGVFQYGFVRSADGVTFTTINYPNTVGQTYVQGINNKGQITGSYFGNGGFSGFLAAPIMSVMVIGSTNHYFDTLLLAYETLSAGSIVTTEAQTSPVFIGGINLNNTVDLTLLGGYDTNFDTPPTGMTTIQGEVIVGSGSLTVSNLIIE
jgi:hypothetical protein